MIYEAHVRGARIGEVPIIFVERAWAVEAVGQRVLESVLTPWRLRLRSLFTRPMTATQRVVMVATSYPRFPGDTVGTFMEPIARGLASRGHEVHLVLPWHPRWQRGTRDGGVTFHSSGTRPCRR